MGRRRLLRWGTTVASLGLVTGLAGLPASATAASAPTSPSASVAATTPSGVAAQPPLGTLRVGRNPTGQPIYGAGTRSTAPTGPSAKALALSDISVVQDPNAPLSPSALSAVQAAVNVWRTQLRTTVPIKVEVSWETLDFGVLGEAGPTNIIRDFSHAPMSHVWYPAALANQLAGSDLNGSSPEISAVFNKNMAWYFGTDGRPSVNQVDLESVVLHELGHGFGFVGSFDVATANGVDTGSWGYDDGKGLGPMPYVFDKFTVDGNNHSLLDTATYPQNSTQLAGELEAGTSGPHWSGAQGTNANGGTQPLLYAPQPYEPGSSYSHLDETTYAPGTPNALMTPILDWGESVHDPGPIMRGALLDMGWTGAYSNCSNSFAGRPTLASNKDGRLEAFEPLSCSGSPTPLTHMWQPKINSSWSSWADLGGNISNGATTVATNGDGRLEVFANSSGAISHAWQATPGGTWKTWSQIPGLPVSAVGVPIIGRYANGRLQVFVRGSDGNLWTATQVVANGNWSSWSNFGGPVVGDPVVGANADGRLELFAVQQDSSLWHRYQTTVSGSWANWDKLGGVNLSTTAPVAERNADGRLEVFTTDQTGQIWHIWQVAPNSRWGAGGSLSNSYALSGGLAIARNADGRLELFANSSTGTLSHSWQTRANGGWANWQPMPTDSSVATSGDPAVGRNADGRLEVFYQCSGTAGSGLVCHNYQLAPNAMWSSRQRFPLP